MARNSKTTKAPAAAAPVKQEAPVADNVTQDAPEGAVEGSTEEGTQGTTEQQQTAPDAPEASTETVITSDEITAEQLQAAAAEKNETFVVVNAFASGIQQTLENYLEALKVGKPVNSATGARAQLTLQAAIKSTITQADAKNFVAGMEVLLTTIAEHRKAEFSELRAFRFIADVALAPNDRKEFERLLHLLLECTVEDAEKRKGALKRVDLDVVFAKSRIGDEYITRLKQYLKRVL